MTYLTAAEKAKEATVAAQEVQQSSDSPETRGLANAIAKLAEAIEDMAETHHRQF